MKRKILLIDTLAQVFRAYYALEKTGLKTGDGLPTFAIYGFFKSFFKVLREVSPTHFIIVSDCKGDCFRKEIFEHYKAHRKKAPQDFLDQLSYLIEMIERIGLPYIEKDGLEADDLIATLAKHYAKGGDQVYVLSLDKDLCQLVNENIFMLHNPKMMNAPFKILGESEVEEKFGVKPSRILDYLSLVGDSSDNIPGVAGIGPKGALELLGAYGNLKGIYDHLDEVSPKFKEKLEANKENAFLSYKLVTLKEDASIFESFNLKTLESNQLQVMRKEFEKLEFKPWEEISLLNAFVEKEGAFSESLFTQEIKEQSLESSSSQESLVLIKEPDSFNKEAVEYYLVTTKKDLESLYERVKKEQYVVIDTETTSLDTLEAQLIGVAMAFKEKQAYYVPFDRPFSTEFSLKEFCALFQDILADEKIKKIGHNLKYDYKILCHYFEKVEGIFFDTMIAAYLLDTDMKRYNMDTLALNYFHYKTISYNELIAKNKKLTLSDIDIEKVKDYSCEDVDITIRFYNLFKEELNKKDLERVFYQIEMPLVKVLAHMEEEGFRIDPHYFTQFSQELNEQIKEIESQIFQKAGKEINLNSPKQVSEFLYNDLELKPSKKKKANDSYSTDEETLLGLKEEPIVRDLLEYRKYFKMYSTYVAPFSKYEKKGSNNFVKIHTSFNQTGTATGRLSSSDPNLQNIPTKDKIGRKIREGFITQPDFTLIGFDYSQIELRFLAHYSHDPFLIKAFTNDEDIHRMTASKIFHKDQSQVSDSERSIAKTINFGIIYGMGAKKLSLELEMSFKEAGEFIKTYFKEFEGIKNFIEQTKKQVHLKEVVETIGGRKRYFSQINTAQDYMVAANERMAVNTIIQGSSADIIKLCMIEIDKKYYKHSSLKPLLQIHDELIFEVKKSECDTISQEIIEIMENIFSLKVPLRVSFNKGENWSSLK
jgi:DNA polymerase-1